MAKSFGLDIGATTMKAVSLSKVGSSISLDAAMVAQTPAKGLLSESTLDREELSQAIRKMIQDARINAKSVHVTLPENQVYTKVIEMPILSDNELASAIYWEAEQQIPVALDTITLDWTVLRKPINSSGQPKMEVLLVGAPTELIDKYVDVLSLTGLTIASLETEIISTVRAIVFGQNLPISVVANIGAVSTSLAIVKEGIITFTYSIPVGGMAVNRAIATDFGLTMGQAEEYKKTYGVSGGTLQGKIGQATTPILMSIVTEIKKAVTFYSEKTNNEPISQILLSGGNAKLPGIDVFFAQNTGIETVTANPFRIITNQELPKELLDNAPEYTIAVGLALKDI